MHVKKYNLKRPFAYISSNTVAKYPKFQTKITVYICNGNEKSGGGGYPPLSSSSGEGGMNSTSCRWNPCHTFLISLTTEV